MAVGFDKLKALMSAVLAGDVAEIAANAFVFVDVSLDVIIQIEISPVGHATD